MKLENFNLRLIQQRKYGRENLGYFEVTNLSTKKTQLLWLSGNKEKKLNTLNNMYKW